MLPLVGIAGLVAALDGDGAVPAPAPSPLTEIHRETSTPFCRVFRDNVFHAVQGLMVNDAVIAAGKSQLARMQGEEGAHDIAQYQLGQTVYEVAANLRHIQDLLNPDRFPHGSDAAADRDLLLMRARLQAVADAQERALNVLSVSYESSAQNDFMGKGDGMSGALGQASVPDKSGDEPLFKTGVPAPGQVLTPKGPVTIASQSGALEQANLGSNGGLNAVRELTAQAEEQVAPAVVPAVNRCNSSK